MSSSRKKRPSPTSEGAVSSGEEEVVEKISGLEGWASLEAALSLVSAEGVDEDEEPRESSAELLDRAGMRRQWKTGTKRGLYCPCAMLTECTSLPLSEEEQESSNSHVLRGTHGRIRLCGGCWKLLRSPGSKTLGTRCVEHAIKRSRGEIAP
jgi:hypothetical protein